MRAGAALARAATVFAVLGDETRLSLVTRLCCEGPLSIARLTDELDMTRQAVTKHLRMMEDAGLVRSAPHGRERIWAVEEKRLADVRRHLEAISSQWDDALGKLKALVEG